MRSALLIGSLLAAPLFSVPAAQAQDGIGSLIDSRVVFPASASQGALVIGKVPAGSRVQYAGRQLRVSGYGSVVFGIGRDEKGPLRVQVQRPDGGSETATIAVTPRDWPTERVNGVPPKTVNPPPAIAERIKREQAQVTSARARDDDRTDFTQTFIWPVQGRISGRFGNARVYNGQPGAGHSGMDIAVPTGTPVKAPAAGIVTFAGPDLYLTGGTLLLDHGFGVSSNFLHLSRIDVKVGDRVEQGQVIAAVGATGRATGPHLHWGMNWFEPPPAPRLVVAPPSASGRPRAGPHPRRRPMGLAGQRPALPGTLDQPRAAHHTRSRVRTGVASIGLPAACAATRARARLDHTRRGRGPGTRVPHPFNRCCAQRCAALLASSSSRLRGTPATPASCRRCAKVCSCTARPAPVRGLSANKAASTAATASA